MWEDAHYYKLQLIIFLKQLIMNSIRTDEISPSYMR